MNLSAPKRSVFSFAIILAVIGLLGKLEIITAVTPHSFWIVFASVIILAAGAMFRGV